MYSNVRRCRGRWRALAVGLVLVGIVVFVGDLYRFAGRGVKYWDVVTSLASMPKNVTPVFPLVPSSSPYATSTTGDWYWVAKKVPRTAEHVLSLRNRRVDAIFKRLEIPLPLDNYSIAAIAAAKSGRNTTVHVVAIFHDGRSLEGGYLVGYTIVIDHLTKKITWSVANDGLLIYSLRLWPGLSILVNLDNGNRVVDLNIVTERGRDRIAVRLDDFEFVETWME